MVGELHPRYAGNDIITCDWCGATTKRRHRNTKTRSNYCSDTCGSAARSHKISAFSKARGGSSHSYLRGRARERDGGRCRICGFELATHVHHIKPKAKGGRHALDNLITLCPNHHALAHAGALTMADLYSSLLKTI